MEVRNQNGAALGTDVPMKRSFKAIEEHLYSELKDEAVVLNLINGKYYGLNSVGVTIWKTLEKSATLSEVEKAVMSEFEIDLVTCHRESLAFLEKMIEEQLVLVDDG